MDYQDQIRRKLKTARKNKNAAEILYYLQAENLSACVDWETFSKSWAGQQWLERNANSISKLENIGVA